LLALSGAAAPKETGATPAPIARLIAGLSVRLIVRRAGLAEDCTNHNRRLLLMTPRFLSPLLLCGALSIPAAHAGPFTNGDFDPDFTGWDGARLDNLSFTDFPDPDTSANFELLGSGRAGLASDATYWVVALSQTFDITNTASPLQVTFDWDWTPTDDAGDTFSMVLEDGSFNAVNFVDELFGAPPDYTAAAAQSLTTSSFLIPGSYFTDTALTIRFAIQDYDLVFDTADTLTIGNISVTEVPVPGVPLLLAGGAALLALGRRRR